jgi:hypothetical protein
MFKTMKFSKTYKLNDFTDNTVISHVNIIHSGKKENNDEKKLRHLCFKAKSTENTFKKHVGHQQEENKDKM